MNPEPCSVGGGPLGRQCGRSHPIRRAPVVKLSSGDRRKVTGLAPGAIKVVVFDLDGTLGNTKSAILACAQQAFASVGLPAPCLAELEAATGLSLPAVLQRASPRHLSAERLETVARAYRRLYPTIAAEHETTFPGVKRMVGVLGREVQLAVATSKSRASAAAFLEREWRADTFERVITDEDVNAKKPAPEMLEVVMDRCDASPSELLMVGDTTFDIEMGQAAAVRTCGVTWGNHPRERLLDAGADYVAGTPGAVSRVVDELRLIGGPNSLSPESPFVAGIT